MPRPNPDFVVFGVAKGGTTALFEYLSQHPALFLSAKKEPHFFACAEGLAPVYSGPGDAAVIGRMFVSDDSAYQALFSDAKSGQQTGEASAMYLAYPEAIGRLLDRNPEARVIITLREPASRAFSSYTHLRRDSREPLDDFAEALAFEPKRIADGWMPIWQYRGLSRYATLLTPLRARVKPERLHVVIFEEFLQEPERHLAAVCRFLGVDADFRFHHDVRKNKSGDPRSRLLHRLHGWLRWGRGKAALKALLPTRLRREAKARAIRALEEHNLRRPTVDPAVLATLRNEFRTDVAFVEDWIGRQIPSWRVDH
jgi:hypothetical protein